jgi:geranylgeranyl diphosphate synthase, type I
MYTQNNLLIKIMLDKIAYAKTTLKNFVPIIDQELDKVWKGELKDAFSSSADVMDLIHNMLNHAKEHNLRPAKRLRAAFIYYTYQLLGGKDTQSILHAATSIELVHTALLMHDDFMDRDVTRRGKPTTHEYYKTYHHNKLFFGNPKHYGDAMAVNVGDICLTMGYKYLNNAPFSCDLKVKALNYLFNGIINTGYGQAYDITLEAARSFVEQNIIDMHHAKTGIYTYQTPMLIGAVLAGAQDSDLDILSEYAIPGGIAFQLQDDILGLYGDEEKTGKSAYADLREGKKTLLILKALEKGDRFQVKKIMELWGNKNIKDEDAEEIRNIVRKTGALKYSQDLAKKFAKKSQQNIPKMLKKGWEKKIVDFFEGIAEYMAVERVS